MKRNPLPRILAFTAVLGLGGVVSCDKPTAASESSPEAEELARVQMANATLENELKMLREDFEKKYNDGLKQTGELQRANDELKQQLEKSQDEFDKSRKELQEHMAKYKISMRQKAKGMQILKLETAESKSYERVTVTELTPHMVSFQHSGGVSRIPLEKLTPEWQQRLLYDPEELKAIEAARVAEKAAKEGGPAEEVPKEVAALVDPTVLKRLNDRIKARRSEIVRIKREAKEVQEGPYGMTSLSRLRLQVLKQRTIRLEDDIKGLQNMLHQAARRRVQNR